MIQLRKWNKGNFRIDVSRITHYALHITCYVLAFILFSAGSVSLADDYYPLNLGDLWLYAAKVTGQANYTQLVVIRQLPSKDRRGKLKDGVLQVISNFDTEDIVEEDQFTKDGNGLNLHKAIVHEGKLLITVTYDSPVRLLKFPLDSEQTWEGKSKMEIELKGEFLQYGQTKIQVLGNYVYKGTVMGEETVSNAIETDAYTCRKVELETELTIEQISVNAADRLNTSFIRQNLPWRKGDVIQSKSSRWLAPGVGEVKFQETTTQARQPPTVTSLLLKTFKPKE